MKQGFLLGLLVTVAIQHVSGTYENLYDCNRPNTGCDGVAPTCNADGSCSSCDAPKTGYGCLLTDSPVCTVAGTPPCNNGVCVGTACECNEGYVDDGTGTGDCTERARVDVCTATSMTVIIQPYGDAAFAGLVYVNGFASTTECVFTCAAATGVCTLTLDYDVTTSPCGGATVNGVTGNQEFLVVVQYLAALLTATDQAITVGCNVIAAGTPVAADSSNVGVTAVTAADLAAVSTSSDSATGVEIKVTDATGVTLAGAQAVGTEIRVITELTQDQFVDLKVTGVKVWNGDQSASVELVLDNTVPATVGCVNPTYVSLVTAFERVTPVLKVSVILAFKMFQFTGSNSMDIVVTYVVCEGADTSACSPPTAGCDPAYPDGFGKRKRRQAPSANEGKLNLTVLVTPPELFAAPKSSCNQINSGEEEGCLKNMVFLLPLVLLTVLLLVSVFMSLFFCLKVSRNRPHSDMGMPNMAYKS